MADNTRQFTLVGNFTDNITSGLNTVNEKLDGILQKLETYKTKLNNLATPMKELGDSIKTVTDAVNAQQTAFRGAGDALNYYSKQQGRANRATKSGGIKLMNAISRNQDRSAFAKAREEGARLKSKAQIDAINSKANATAESIRAKGEAAAAKEYARAAQIRSRIRGPGGGGGGGGGGGVGRVAGAAVGGTVIGTQLSGILEGAIVSGFRIGVGLMQAPFKYFANALQERIGDEISDLRTAGALFGISKRQDKPFLTGFDDAIEFTQENNRILANLAADLPGATRDYIQVFKQTVDTLARAVTKDTAGTVKLAEEIRQKEPEFYGTKAITGTGAEAQKAAIATLTGELTKKTVLAGFGGGGQGGVAGPYGLPALTERLISQDQVSVGQFQRYAAIFRDPAILDALKRNVDKINRTTAESADRIRAANTFFDEVLPPELVERLRASTSGVIEALKTAILGEETGFLGIGRKIQGLGKKINVYGQYLDATGKVVTDISKAAPANLSLFELFRDIFVNVGRVLVPIIDLLPQIWDPLKAIGLQLTTARDAVARFRRNFEGFLKGWTEFAKNFKGTKEEKSILTGSRYARAALDTIAALFEHLGIIGPETRKTLTAILKNPAGNLGAVLKQLLETFFKSKLAEDIGRFLGNIIGTTLAQVGNAAKFISGIATTGGFAGGFAEAFRASGGPQGIKDIFSSIIKLFLDAVKAVFTAAPLESAILVAISSLPAIISGGLTNLITGAFSRVGGGGRGAQGGGRGGFGFGGAGLDVGGFFGPTRSARAAQLKALRSAKQFGRSTLTAAQPLLNYVGNSRIGRGAAGLARGAGGLARGVGSAVKGVSRFIPGGAFLGGAVSLATSIATGEDVGKAAAGAFGSVIGGAAGAFFGPAGLVIGSAVGDWGGRKIADALDPATRRLSEAAAAADRAAAKYAGTGQADRLGGVENVLGKVGDPAQLQNRLLGLQERGILSDEDLAVLQKSGFTSAVSELDRTTQEVEKLKKEELYAAQNNLSSLASIRAKREEAEGRQKRAAERAAAAWEKLTTKLQTTLLNNTSQLDITLFDFRTGLSRIAKFLVNFRLPSLPGLPPNPVDAAADKLGFREKILRLLGLGGEGWRRSSSGEGCKVSGGLGNKAAGSVDSFNSIARSKGLSLTSGYRPGSPGWHGVNRARDYSNGYAPTPQMMSFAKYMAENYGAKLKELIYTPLGYSIKNGRKVPPYARAGHYNHVHVAYGLGFPTPFSSLEGARAFEKAVTPGSVKIASVTGRSDEGFGGTTNVTNNITIQQQPGESMDHLASMVALKISNAVNEARASSYYV